jgi:hypothetical protein
MIGKSLYSLLVILMSWSAISAESGFDTAKFLKDLKGLELDEFLHKEIDYDKKLKDYLVEKNRECMDTEYLLQATLDQSKCFERLRLLKIKYTEIKYTKKSKVIVNSFNEMKAKLRLLHQQKVKAIQSSSPEDDLFFEL